MYMQQAISGTEKGERIAMLLSPTSSSPTPGLLDSISQPSGSMFTSFLTAPLQAFLMLIGISGSDIEMVNVNSHTHTHTHTHTFS